MFGEKISYCTIKRLIYQTITSLIVSAAITLLTGGINDLFFCTINIYRSTGTVDRHTQNEKYVSSMKIEKDSSMKMKRARTTDAKKTNIEVGRMTSREC